MCLQIFSQISLSVFSWSWTVLHSLRGDDVYFLLWPTNFSLCKILPYSFVVSARNGKQTRAAPAL